MISRILEFTKNFVERQRQRAALRKAWVIEFQNFVEQSRATAPSAPKYPQAALYRLTWRRAFVLEHFARANHDSINIEKFAYFQELAIAQYLPVAPMNAYGKVPLSISPAQGRRLLQFEKSRAAGGDPKPSNFKQNHRRKSARTRSHSGSNKSSDSSSRFRAEHEQREAWKRTEREKIRREEEVAGARHRRRLSNRERDDREQREAWKRAEREKIRREEEARARSQQHSRNFAPQSSKIEWWVELGISKDAPLSLAESAFKELAKIYHPDGHKVPNEEKMKSINRAIAEARKEARKDL